MNASNPFKIPFAFSQLIKGLIDGEEEFVKEMKTFTCHQLNYLDSSHLVPINIFNQKEVIFRNIKDIVFLHERSDTYAKLRSEMFNKTCKYMEMSRFRSLLPGLTACVTDDDVAMHLIKHSDDFEKYLHYMVGQAQAEACVSDKAVQQYLKVFTKSL